MEKPQSAIQIMILSAVELLYGCHSIIHAPSANLTQHVKRLKVRHHVTRIEPINAAE